MGSPLLGAEQYAVKRTHRQETALMQSKNVVAERRPAPRDVWSGQLVLCLDGGGIKAYSSLIVLQALLDEIMRVERSIEPFAQSSGESPLFQPASATTDDDALSMNTDYSAPAEDAEDAYRLCHYFDYICGTSLGGITAIMLGTMRLTLRETIERSKTIWRGVIPGYTTKLLRAAQLPVKRNTSKLQKRWQHALEGLYGTDGMTETRSGDVTSRSFLEYASTTMKAGDGQCQTIVFTMQDSKGVLRPYAIRSYSRESVSDPLIRNPAKDTTVISLVDACRATSAARDYFHKARIDDCGSFSDGSAWISNPAAEVYREIHDLHARSGTPIRALLSVGYQESPRRSTFDSDADATALETAGLDDADEMLRERRKTEGFEYDRIRCPASTTSSGDLDKLFQRLEEQAIRFCNTPETKSKIRYWAEYLVSARRKRAQTIHWETYAGLQRACPFCTTGEVFTNRDTLATHIEMDHKIETNSPTTATQPKRISMMGLKSDAGMMATGRRHSAR